MDTHFCFSCESVFCGITAGASSQPPLMGHHKLVCPLCLRSLVLFGTRLARWQAHASMHSRGTPVTLHYNLLHAGSDDGKLRHCLVGLMGACTGAHIQSSLTSVPALGVGMGQCVQARKDVQSFHSNSIKNIYSLYFCFYIFRVNSLVHIFLLVDTSWQLW